MGDLQKMAVFSCFGLNELLSVTRGWRYEATLQMRLVWIANGQGRSLHIS